MNLYRRSAGRMAKAISTTAARSSPPTIHSLRLDAPATVDDEALAGAAPALACWGGLVCAAGFCSAWFWLLETVEALAVSGCDAVATALACSGLVCAAGFCSVWFWLLETVEALAVSGATGCDAVVDSVLVEGDCATDCPGGELVWLAVVPALASSIPPSGAACRRR